MDRYSSLLALACFAASTCWLAGVAVRNAEELDRSQGHVAACIVVLEGEVRRLEELVGPYLTTYREVLLPQIQRDTE